MHICCVDPGKIRADASAGLARRVWRVGWTTVRSSNKQKRENDNRVTSRTRKLFPTPPVSGYLVVHSSIQHLGAEGKQRHEKLTRTRVEGNKTKKTTPFLYTHPLIEKKATRNLWGRKRGSFLKDCCDDESRNKQTDKQDRVV